MTTTIRVTKVENGFILKPMPSGKDVVCQSFDTEKLAESIKSIFQIDEDEET